MYFIMKPMPSLFATFVCYILQSSPPFWIFSIFPLESQATTKMKINLVFPFPPQCALNNSVYNETVCTCRTEVDNNFLRQELKAKYVLELYLLKQKHLYTFHIIHKLCSYISQ